MNPRPKPLGAALGWLAALLLILPVSPPDAAAQGQILGGNVQKQHRTEAQVKSRIEYLKKQLVANPDNYRYHFELGNLYADTQKISDAMLSYREALRLNSKYVEAMVNLGSLLSDASKYDEAIEQFEEALRIDPEDCKARSNLGNAYYAEERYPDAMFEYLRAVELDPKCYSALYNIAVAFADVGMFREAVRWWRKVEQVAPGTDAARNARENITLLERFTALPPPSARGTKNDD
jgi:tetratricopeptide (TPR) repeat protein